MSLFKINSDHIIWYTIKLLFYTIILSNNKSVSKQAYDSNKSDIISCEQNWDGMTNAMKFNLIALEGVFNDTVDGL